jgi:protocatechuate 3,4-dioxygenase beta subunit
MKNALRLFLLTLSMIWLATAAPVQAQSQVITIAILPVQDESGTQVPRELLERIGREFRQKLTLAYQDILVRPLKGATDSPDKGVEQLAAMASQQGMRYLLRSGVLDIVSETGGQELRCDVGLYAELIASEGATVTSLRANGSGSESNPQMDDARRWDAYDFTGKTFSRNALGQALNAAVDQLAQQVHQSLVPALQTPAGSTAAEAPAQTSTDDQSDVSYQADQELQQIIAQADSLVASGVSSGRDIGSLQQSLEGLRNALNSKVSLMTQGQDSAAADQEIERYKAELQGIIAASAQEAVLQPPTEESQPLSAELSSGISRVNELLGEALNCILKIQEINTAVQSFRQDQATSSDTGQDYVPVEEPTSDISGVVTDDSGNPVEGATVSEPQSGASATTDASGSYIIPHIPSNRVAIIKVIRAGKELSTGKIQLQPGRMALADWRIGSASASKPLGVRILPATVIVSSKAARTVQVGTIRGMVRDAKGQPLARALVMVRGLGMARTDSRGSYTFVNVPQGEYQVMVQQGGSTVQSQRVSVAAKKVVESSTLYKGRALSAAPPLRKSVLARGSGSSLKGTVRGTNGQPLPGAKITAIHTDGVMSLFTNAKGAYEFKDLKQGSYRLLASKAGYQGTGGTVSLKAGQSDVREFKLEKSSIEIQKALSVTPLPMAGTTKGGERLLSGRTAATATGRLTGLVRDARSNAPIEGAMIQFFGTQSVRSDRRGVYRIDDVAPGRYRVTAAHRNYQQQSLTVAIRSGQTGRQDFSLKTRDRQDGTVTATPLFTGASTGYGQVRGNVSDARSGKPLERATVTIGARSTRTSASGDYGLEGIAAGSVTLTIEKSGYQDFSRRIRIQAGKTTIMDFRMTPAGNIQLQKKPPLKLVPLSP